MKFGEKVKKIMEEKQITQTQLAKDVGMDRSELNRTVNDKRQPSVDEIPSISQALGVTIEKLLEGVELPPRIDKKVKNMSELVRNILTAQSERDNAKAKVKTLEKSITNLLNEAKEEHKRLSDKCEKKLNNLEDDHKKSTALLKNKINDLELENEKFHRELNNQIRLTRESNEECLYLKQRIEKINKQLVMAEKSKVLVGVVSALGGALFGKGMSNNNKEEYYEEEDDDEWEDDEWEEDDDE